MNNTASTSKSSKKSARVYGKPPSSMQYRLQIPNLEFLDACGFKTNVKTIREGDWICMFCQNLNFSFRNECNRCQAHAEPQLLGLRNEPFQANFMDFSNIGGFVQEQREFQGFSKKMLENSNELFEKVTKNRQDGFSNVVFIDFEMQDSSEESSEGFQEDFEGRQLEQSTPILEMIDE